MGVALSTVGQLPFLGSMHKTTQTMRQPANDAFGRITAARDPRRMHFASEATFLKPALTKNISPIAIKIISLK